MSLLHKTLVRWALPLTGAQGGGGGGNEEEVEEEGCQHHHHHSLLGGVELCRLVQCLSGRHLSFHDTLPGVPLTPEEKLANARAALGAMQAEGVLNSPHENERLAEDLAGGKVEVLEEVAWQLMLHYHCQWRSPLSPAEASAKSSSRIILAPHRCDELSVEQGLLAWTRALLANSQELPCVSDLTAETWRDGKLMCALVRQLCGADSPIDPQEVLSTKEGEANLNRAFEAAEANLQVPRLLDARDFFPKAVGTMQEGESHDSIAERRSLMAYLASLRNCASRCQSSGLSARPTSREDGDAGSGSDGEGDRHPFGAKKPPEWLVSSKAQGREERSLEERLAELEEQARESKGVMRSISTLLEAREGQLREALGTCMEAVAQVQELSRELEKVHKKLATQQKAPKAIWKKTDSRKEEGHEEVNDECTLKMLRKELEESKAELLKLRARNDELENAKTSEEVIDKLRRELKHKEIQLTTAQGRAKLTESEEKRRIKERKECVEELKRNVAAAQAEAGHWREQCEVLKAELARAEDRRRRLEGLLPQSLPSSDVDAAEAPLERSGKESREDDVSQLETRQKREEGLKELLTEAEEEIDKLEEELKGVKKQRNDLQTERDNLLATVGQLRHEKEEDTRKARLAALEAQRRDDEIERLRAQHRQSKRRLSISPEDTKWCSESYLGAVDVSARVHNPMSSHRVEASPPPKGIAKRMSAHFEEISTKPRLPPPAGLAPQEQELQVAAVKDKSADAGSGSDESSPVVPPAGTAPPAENSQQATSRRLWARMGRVDYKAVAAMRKSSSLPPPPNTN